MSFLTNLGPLLQLILTIGVVVAGLGYAYGQFFSGRKKEASEQTLANTVLIEGLQSQINGFEKLVERMRNEHKAEVEQLRIANTKLTGEVGELRGQIKEKESKLAEYKQIFQGRDPSNEAFTKFMTESAMNTSKCFDVITKTLVKLEEWAQKIDGNLEKIAK